MVGVKDAFPKALKFAEELKEDQRPVLSELGQQAWIDFKMSTIADERRQGTRRPGRRHRHAACQETPRLLRVRHQPGADARDDWGRR